MCCGSCCNGIETRNGEIIETGRAKGTTQRKVKTMAHQQIFEGMSANRAATGERQVYQ